MGGKPKSVLGVSVFNMEGARGGQLYLPPGKYLITIPGKRAEFVEVGPDPAVIFYELPKEANP